MPAQPPEPERRSGQDEPAPESGPPPYQPVQPAEEPPAGTPYQPVQPPEEPPAAPPYEAPAGPPGLAEPLVPPDEEPQPQRDIPPSDLPWAGPTPAEPIPPPGPPAMTPPPMTPPPMAPPEMTPPPMAPPEMTPPPMAPPEMTPPPMAPPPPPIGAPPSGPSGYATPGPVQPARQTNSMAIVALICSIAGIFTGISAPVGVVLGHMAKRQIAQTGEEGNSLATAALIIGYIITGLLLAACCGFVVLTVTAVAQS